MNGTYSAIPCPPKTFESDRLVYRALTPQDAQTVFDLYSSCEIATRYMAWPRAKELSNTLPFLHGVERSFRGEEGASTDYSWLISCRVGVGEGDASCFVFLVNLYRISKLDLCLTLTRVRPIDQLSQNICVYLIGSWGEGTRGELDFPGDEANGSWWYALIRKA